MSQSGDGDVDEAELHEALLEGVIVPFDYAAQRVQTDGVLWQKGLLATPEVSPQPVGPRVYSKRCASCSTFRD